MSLLGPREGRAGSRLFSVFHGPDATASHVADATQEAGWIIQLDHTGGTPSLARAMVRQGRSELTARANTRLNGASPLFLVRNLSFSLHGAQRSVHRLVRRSGAVREGEGEGKVVEPCGHVPLHD